MVMPCYGEPGSGKIAHRCHAGPVRNSHEVTVGKRLVFSHLGRVPFGSRHLFFEMGEESPQNERGVIQKVKASSRGPLGLGSGARNYGPLWRERPRPRCGAGALARETS